MAKTAAPFTHDFQNMPENLELSPHMNNAWPIANSTLGLHAMLWSNHGDFLASKHCFLSACFAQENELQEFLQENKHLNLQLFNNSHKAPEYEKVRGDMPLVSTL